MMTIEFFHDVICSFCFPMSARLRRMIADRPNVEVIHRSFALGWEEEDFVQMFGSRKQVKDEVLTHWYHANQNDEEHRFNIAGMAAENFDFPTSKNGLIAAKAAGILAGQDAYWEVFDALQAGLFIHSMNIEDKTVICRLVEGTSVDFDEWHRLFVDKETETAVLNDFQLAHKYQLQGVPALVVNGKYMISGAQPTDKLVETLNKIAEENATVTLEALGDDNPACNMNEDGWQCD
nr:DsbA family protein [Enterococcus sp. BWR-S5]